MALNPAILFPITPDGNFAITYTHEHLTDVQKTRGGVEIRASLLEYASRRLDYTVSNFNDRELAQFRDVWINATERLRYLVPIWCEGAVVSDIPDANTVTAVMTDLDFSAGQKTLLWRDEFMYQLVTIDTLSGAGFTTIEAIDPSFFGRVIQAFPVMTAWLVPPNKDLVAADGEHIGLSFEEEPPGIAGLDATVGDFIVAEGVTFLTTIDHAPTGYSGRRDLARSVYVFDASGQRIMNPELIYTVTPTGALLPTDPGVRITYPNNGQQIHAEYPGNSSPGFYVDVAYGALVLNTLI